MIEVKNRQGEPVADENGCIEVIWQERNVRFSGPTEITIPLELSIPEGYQAIFTGIGSVPMPNGGWNGFIRHIDGFNVIPSGNHCYGEGYATVWVQGEGMAGAGSPVMKGQTIGYLHFEKVAPKVLPNRGFPGRKPKKEAA